MQVIINSEKNLMKIEKDNKMEKNISNNSPPIKPSLICQQHLGNENIFESLKENNINIQPFYGIINNEYCLIKKIGRGSTSKVYLGYLIEDKIQTSIKKYYSIKVINSKKVDINIFKSEVDLLKKIKNHNILAIYNHDIGILKKFNGKSKEIYYIVMDYLEHGELIQYINNVSPRTGENIGFGEEYGRLILWQLLDALEYIHNSNVVHRDIKLNNIMISGDDYSLKLVDFGFATEKNMGYLTSFPGTPNYAAPELHLKIPYLGVYEDIFSLGVTLFILVTGSLPFRSSLVNDGLYQYIARNNYIEYWKKRNIKVSPNFMELFDNMVAFDCTQRPSISEIRCSNWMKEISFDLLPNLKQEFIFREKKIFQNKLYQERLYNINKQTKKNISLIEKKRPKRNDYFPINNNFCINKNKTELINNETTDKNINNSDSNHILNKVDNKIKKIRAKKILEVEKEIKGLIGMTNENNNNESLLQEDDNNKNNLKKTNINNFDNKFDEDNENFPKGFIKIKCKVKSPLQVLNLLKTFLKNNNYYLTKRCAENLNIEVSNGEVDILLWIERLPKDIIKICYKGLNGLKEDYLKFKKTVKNFNLIFHETKKN